MNIAPDNDRQPATLVSIKKRCVWLGAFPLNASLMMVHLPNLQLTPHFQRLLYTWKTLKAAKLKNVRKTLRRSRPPLLFRVVYFYTPLSVFSSDFKGQCYYKTLTTVADCGKGHFDLVTPDGSRRGLIFWWPKGGREEGGRDKSSFLKTPFRLDWGVGDFFLGSPAKKARKMDTQKHP